MGLNLGGGFGASLSGWEITCGGNGKLGIGSGRAGGDEGILIVSDGGCMWTWPLLFGKKFGLGGMLQDVFGGTGRTVRFRVCGDSFPV